MFNPAEPVALTREIPESLGGLMTGYWQVIAENTGLDIKHIARQSLLAPVKCCVKSLEFAADREIQTTGDNPGASAGEASVEKAYEYLKALSQALRARFVLDI